jgi:aspartate aminotransferase
VKGLEKHPDVAIMSDEIYDVMTYDGEEHTRCSISRNPRPADRAQRLVQDLGDDRLAHGLVDLAERPKSGNLYDKVRKLAVNCWSCVNAPSQFAGIAAIDGPQDEVDEDDAAFDRRRKARGRGAEQAARRFLHHAEGRLLRLPEHLGDRAGRRRSSPRRCWRKPASH